MTSTAPATRRRGSTTRLRAVAYPVGLVVLGLAAVMGACSVVGVGYHLAGAARPGVDDHASMLMLASSLLAAMLGGGLWRLGAPAAGEPLARREAVLAVTLIWFGASVVGALPFILGAGIGPIDALFESTSGFTTTGSTIVTDIEGSLSRPLLLWRSVIQWLGGMGIVVLFVAVFPSLGVGAKHMFRSEVPGHDAGGLQPRITDTAMTLWKIYAGLTALEIAALVGLGMDPFEAVCHAFTSLSGGGFSTRDASVAAFESPAIEAVIATFLLSGGVNFALYYAFLAKRRPGVFWRSTELRAFLALVVVAVGVVAVGILPRHGYQPLQALRYAYFFVASTITSTGYVTDDYMAYPPPILGIMVSLMLVGGCSGSTAGGMKVSRIVLLAKTTWREIRHTVRPQVVDVVRLSRRPVADDVLLEVAAFFFAYLGVILAGVLAVSFTDGVPIPTAFGAMVTTIGNNGPAPWYVGADHFAAYSEPAKLVFVVTMILGRLELLTVLALLHRDLWR